MQLKIIKSSNTHPLLRLIITIIVMYVKRKVKKVVKNLQNCKEQKKINE